MEKTVLNVEARADFKKGGCKHLRSQGKIPAVVYSEGKIGVNVQIDSKELWHALHTEAGENAIILMNIMDDGKQSTKNVIVKAIQIHPINDKFLHVDFHEISLTDKLKVKVPVVVKGEAIGVKESDGVLTQILWEVEVECLPTEIPEHVNVHVDELKLNEAIHIKELQVPEGVTLLENPEKQVVSVHPPKAEEEEVAEGEETGEGGAEPEVIKRRKTDEEGAEDEAGSE